MLFGKIPQSFCIRSFVCCLSCDYRTQEFRVGAQVGDFCFDDFHSLMAPQIKPHLQSIYVTRDRVILKFEARVQIYVAVLNIGCKIRNSGGNVVGFSKINSCEISF